MKWCEFCQDHFEVDHFDKDGYHKVGDAYGPVGAEHQEVDDLRTENERLRERLLSLEQAHDVLFGSEPRGEGGP